jgi:DeoR/GlpR family transcriptional regulator of sugar metabolism
MRGPGQITSQRRQRLDQIEGRGSVRVSELAAALQVSELTIRRDLDELSEEGLVERFHGGAQLAHASRRDSLFVDKALQHAAEKEVIGAQAAALVKADDTVGSATLAVMRRLRRRHVRIVTNNAAVAADFTDAMGEIIILEGALRARSRSLVGDVAGLTTWPWGLPLRPRAAAPAAIPRACFNRSVPESDPLRRS